MGLFKKKEKEPIGPYGKIEAHVKYVNKPYYVCEEYYAHTAEEWEPLKAQVINHYNNLKAMHIIDEKMVWVFI